MLFEKGEIGEEKALEYLQTRVPKEVVEKDIDLSPLYEELFNIPKDFGPGHHEFEGKNNFKVSFDIVDITNHISIYDCLEVYRKDDSVDGSYHPIYSIENLIIKTDNFSYDLNDHERTTSISWVPGLKTTDKENSRHYSRIEARHIYMIDKDGYFARPIDLLAYFHELGHSETRSPRQMNAESMTVLKQYSSAGFKTEPAKIGAYELQRERDADAYMLQKIKSLMKDLNIDPSLAVGHRTQSLETYHKLYRKRIASILKKRESEV